MKVKIAWRRVIDRQRRSKSVFCRSVALEFWPRRLCLFIPLPSRLLLHAQSLHFDFLSQIKPVYLLRTRAYSRTISKKPFLVNYQGAQFRVYPGEYQCLLDVGSRYKRVSNGSLVVIFRRWYERANYDALAKKSRLYDVEVVVSFQYSATAISCAS